MRFSTRRGLAALSIFALAGCSKKATPLAELVKADGPVEKQQEAETTWAAAAVGTEFFLGEAAKTGDKTAQLTLTGGGAQLAMQPHTILRFGGKGAPKIGVEEGAVDLSGTGNYTLDVGDVKIAKTGTIRITAKGVELTVGEAQVQTVTGTVDLVVGKPIEVGDVSVTTVVADAGVRDAPVDAVPLDATEDAATPEVGEATIDVTGKKAELLGPDGKWQAIAPGSSQLGKGAKVRVGVGTTAKLVARGTTLEMAGGSRVALGDDYGVTLEAGNVRATAASDATIALPGGNIALKGSDKVPSDSKLESGSSTTKVTMQRGTAKLVGTGDAELVLNRGESATLARTGKITPLEAIPSYFDFRIPVGETFTIHDPRPAPSVQFMFGDKCTEGGIIELDRDARFRTAKVSAGKSSANHSVKTGSWAYRLRCTRGASEGAAVAQGRILVVQDSGTRALPKAPPVNPFDVDGRRWVFSYQSVIPDLAVKFPGAGSSFTLHLSRGGKDLTFDSSSPSLRIPGSALTEGTYTYWFDRDGVKQDKTSTLAIDFDQTAPQVYIELPVNGKAWSGDIDVKGAVLAGWSAVVDDVAIPIDSRRRFIAKVGTPPGNALAIRLAHPMRGIHYYLRRAK